LSLFEEQVKQRDESDQQAFENSFYHVVEAVLGSSTADSIVNANYISQSTIEDILKAYKLRPEEIPANIEKHEDRMEYCLRPHGIYSRKIVLSPGWYKDSYGPIMGYIKESGEPVALLPGRGGYYYIDHKTNKRIRINKTTASELLSDAYCFYRPLPQKKLSIRDLLIYIKSYFTMGDVVMLIMASLAVTLVGFLFPKYTKALTGPILMDKNLNMLLGLSICMLFTVISSQLFISIKGMINARLIVKSALGVQTAMIMRLMSLPVAFFRKFPTGELMNRFQAVDTLCKAVMKSIVDGGLMSLLSLIYITQIFSFTPALLIPSILIIIVTIAFCTITSIVQVGVSEKQLEFKAKESGMSYSVIQAVPKIKLEGAEKRFFSRWLRVYADSVQLTYSPPLFLKLNSVITLAIGLISNIILYFEAVRSGVTQSDYYAFSVTFGLVMGALGALANVSATYGQIKPALEMAKPFLEELPETSEKREEVLSLSGDVELNNVSFRYFENTPYVLENLSLKIKQGEYVAIVGRTGCGKSTLVRLLLGFEQPIRGGVYYGSKNISSLDLSSLRRHIGVVMQNGGLFQGDIYSNIVISAPELGVDDAWEAAEIAGIADDIRAMPMGMNTMISERQGGISGGQKQRLMIARAIVSKPKILIFDEATSALDNVTQKKVSDALDKMGCTRIVIAHRFSTIKNCDRILVMDNGKIVETGSFAELMAKNGLFTELVERQRL